MAIKTVVLAALAVIAATPAMAQGYPQSYYDPRSGQVYAFPPRVNSDDIVRQQLQRFAPPRTTHCTTIVGANGYSTTNCY